MTATSQFERINIQMPGLLDQLQACPLRNRSDLRDAPMRGVYVLYENGAPIYVGRSNRLRERILEHSRPSSRHNSATFAFLLALEAAGKKERVFESRRREALQFEPVFRELFREAKERVSRMTLRYIEVTDPIDQTVFEVYAALALKTPYNDFETH